MTRPAENAPNEGSVSRSDVAAISTIFTANKAAAQIPRGKRIVADLTRKNERGNSRERERKTATSLDSGGGGGGCGCQVSIVIRRCREVGPLLLRLGAELLKRPD